MVKEQSLQQMVVGKLDSHMHEKETEPLSCTTHKKQLKRDQILEYKTRMLCQGIEAHFRATV